MNNKERIEKILGADFITRFNFLTKRKITIQEYCDRPDLICVDNLTKKTVGIEVTELLESEYGKDRAFSARAFQCVNQILKKYCSGGIVSIGFGTRLPENNDELIELKNALSKAICDAGGIEPFAISLKRKEWEFKKFKITEVFINEHESKWEPLTDAPLPYQSQSVDQELLIKCVAKKAKLSESYDKTDELILLIRNPHKKWKPNNTIISQIHSAKGKHIDSVWIINWKMDTMPCLPDIIRIDA
jgi:hypothetical protein